jgi:hypothetical protein
MEIFPNRVWMEMPVASVEAEVTAIWECWREVLIRIATPPLALPSALGERSRR